MKMKSQIAHSPTTAPMTDGVAEIQNAGAAETGLPDAEMALENVLASLPDLVDAFLDGQNVADNLLGYWSEREADPDYLYWNLQATLVGLDAEAQSFVRGFLRATQQFIEDLTE